MERLIGRALTRRMNDPTRTAQHLPAADLPAADLPAADLPVAEAACPERKGTR
jgi:hypothetical protein